MKMCFMDAYPLVNTKFSCDCNKIWDFVTYAANTNTMRAFIASPAYGTVDCLP
jgi:hypothetical protein